MRQTERYGMIEFQVCAEVFGNPYKDYELYGSFYSKNEKKIVRGFYDGEGVFIVRFMPSFEGIYTCRLNGNFLLEDIEETFEVLPAGKNNHGVVRTVNQFHFAYDDGTMYYPVGTTCYAWCLQTEYLQKKTLETLSEGPFNKVRFCIFPKHYRYNLKEPACYPYELREESPWKPEDYREEDLEQLPRNILGGIPLKMKHPEKVWDFERFRPEYFRHIETCIIKLQELGIEADLILFHPYDRWGFAEMSTEDENLYIQYVVSRFSAFRNVWWSLANEYDLFREKSLIQWEENAGVLVKEDAYHHLRSIHNCMRLYDYTRPWITHCSIQRVDLYKTAENTIEWRIRYGKPIVLDEIAYEGNLSFGWGNISGEEMTRRFWEAYTRGGYGMHGETYTHPENILWWSHGGTLHGSSPSRIAFLRRIIEEAPGNGLEPTTGIFDESVVSDRGSAQPAGYYLYYYGANRPGERDYNLPASKKYRAQIIDTWEMTIEECGIVSGRFTLPLPGKAYIAVRFIEEAVEYII